MTIADHFPDPDPEADEVLCEGCGGEFDKSEINDEGLCPDCEEQYNNPDDDTSDDLNNERRNDQ